MARRKPARKVHRHSAHRSARRASRRSSRAFSWARFWSDMGLKPVYQYWKKWPYSKPFSAFLGSFFVAMFAMMMVDRGTGPTQLQNSMTSQMTTTEDELTPPPSRTATTSTRSPSGTYATNVDAWSEYVQNLYTTGKWSSGFWKNFGTAPHIQDSAPLTSSRFDCTTYVETVGALVRSSGYEDFYSQLTGIRYDGRGTGYLNRNHFPEIDWIPNNTQAGNLVDITNEVASKAGLMARVEEKTIDKSRWLAKQMGKGGVDRSLASEATGSWTRPVTVQLPYIPLSEVDRVVDSIPSGAVINLVRENNEAHDLLVAHQGFFIRQGNQAMFRHSTTKGKIQTVPLKTYFGFQQKKHWPLIGINVNAFTQGDGAGFQPK